jgi:hypothetical protein
LITREEVVVTDSACTGFAITIDDKNYAIACPHSNLKTLEITQTEPYKSNPKQGEWEGCSLFVLPAQGIKTLCVGTQ